MTTPVLALNHVSYAYGTTAILRDFHIIVARGQHSLLLGPSGSGKTTLINLVSGLLTPDAGEISIAGEAMAGSAGTRDSVRRRRIGVIFQTLRLVEALSIAANLRLAQRLSGRGEDRDEIARLLDRLGLAHRAQATPRSLSQGEAQRAAVARALVTRPDLLIADEPTSALDDANADRVARLLVETADAQGSTLLIATHDARLRAHIGHTLVLQPVREIAG